MKRKLSSPIVGAISAAPLWISACGDNAIPSESLDSVCGLAPDTAGLDELGVDPGLPSYSEFKAQFLNPTASGGAFVEDDIYLADEAAISAFYLDRVVRPALAAGSGDSESQRAFTELRSAVACRSDLLDDIWDVHRQHHLSYCYGVFPTQELESATRLAVAAATAQWERAADINFIHLPELDGEACEHGQGGAFFRIREGDNGDCGLFGCPLARAFFPSSPPEGREVLLWPSILTDERPTTWVLLHELGHVLGLFHEHARFNYDLDDPQTLSCHISGGNPSFAGQWRATTPVDLESVMGYPQCPPFSPPAPSLSPLDRLGARYLYNLPRQSTPSLAAGSTGSGILWFSPGSSFYHMWEPSDSDGVEFQEFKHCYQSTDALCVGKSSSRWRPFPLEIDGSTASEFFFFGPGEVEDEVFLISQASAPALRLPLSIDARHTVPVVSRLSGSTTKDDIWWYSPGPGADPYFDFVDAQAPPNTPDFAGAFAADNYLEPTVGQFDRLGPPALASPGSQILWTAESTAVATLQFKTSSNTWDETVIFPSLCDIESGVEYDRIVGNFDSDPLDDLLWYSPELGSATLWRSVSRCNSSHQTFLAAHGARPIAGDYDGDGLTDILWYDPVDPALEVWMFKSSSLASVSVPTPGDAIAIVGRFNGDPCDDIVWYAPQATKSAVWRSECDGTFAIEEPVQHPADAYPVGYNQGHGRKSR